MTTRSSSKTVAGRRKKTTAKRKYTKRERKPKLVLPSGLPLEARRVTVADPDALERGELWLQKLDGTFYNVATPDATTFDEIIRTFIDLPDPSWPLFWRSWILSQGNGALPLFHILPEHLTEPLKAQFDTLGIERQEGESSQTRFLAQQQGPESDDDDEPDDEPEPIAADASKELVGVE